MSIEVNELLNKYNISLEDVIAWAKTKYPSYLGNVKALVILYLKQVKGITVADNKGKAKLQSIELPTIKRISEAKEGQKYKIKALLIDILDHWTFAYCRNCRKVVKGKQNICPDCKKPTSTKYAWKYLFADDEKTFPVLQYTFDENDQLKSGEYILIGKVLTSNGNKSEKGEKILILDDWQSIDEKKEENMKKLRTLFTISPKWKIAELQEFLRNEKINMTVEEVCKTMNAEIQGDEVVMKK
jgi:hypothetical protein